MSDDFGAVKLSPSDVTKALVTEGKPEFGCESWYVGSEDPPQHVPIYQPRSGTLEDCEDWLRRHGFRQVGTEFPECFEWTR